MKPKSIKPKASTDPLTVRLTKAQQLQLKLDCIDAKYGHLFAHMQSQLDEIENKLCFEQLARWNLVPADDHPYNAENDPFAGSTVSPRTCRCCGPNDPCYPYTKYGCCGNPPTLTKEDK